MALLDELPKYQCALYDDENDSALAEGHTGPLAWNGDTARLSDGMYVHALGASCRVVAPGAPSTPCAHWPRRSFPTARQRGLAAELLGGMRELARRQGLRLMIAPVRPSWKERYPLTAIERYIAWRREDGELLDPWMRLHERLGARVATALPLHAPHRHDRRLAGGGPAWPSPESGDYVFPHGLTPVTIDCDADVGTYYEPNVWMVHPELT